LETRKINSWDSPARTETAKRRSPAGLHATSGQNQRQRVIDSLCRTLLGVHARINQEKMRTLDEQHNGRKKIIRYKTDLSIEINRDSYNHVVHHAHSLIFD
jgi:RNase P/RNase MRP subunit p29